MAPKIRKRITLIQHETTHMDQNHPKIAHNPNMNTLQTIAKHVEHYAKELGYETAEVFGHHQLYITVCTYATITENIDNGFRMPILVLIPYDTLKLNTEQELTNQLKTTTHTKLQEIYSRLGPTTKIKLTIRHKNTKKLTWLTTTLKETLKDKLTAIHYRPKRKQKPTNRSSEET